MKLIVSAFICVFAFVRLPVNGVTLCRPLSKFRVDCNICTCSNSGREYSCTTTICPPIPYKDKYNIVESEDGHLIFKPKNSEQYVFDDNNNFDLTDDKIRETRERIPYIDDEMPFNQKEMEDPRKLAPDIEVDDEKTYLDDQKDLELEEWIKNENGRDYDDSNVQDRVVSVRRDVIN